ncbi:hypothetical protein B0H67DRAFT_595791 [Lasiosphaeris hirsuta]|uniref:Uncharacterized protein n=1 Tax=Lasiosphaeris hirsuta TaxID=260670 RepID=A0AA40DF98_9PEZI|nr:hypothetical protein B0H67DRAFT_595791 [Lasiosphaeris hirsuta]
MELTRPGYSRQPFVIDHLIRELVNIEIILDQWMRAILVVGAGQDWIMFDTLLRDHHTPAQGWGSTTQDCRCRHQDGKRQSFGF